MFRLWVWFATVLGLLRVSWHGRERLRGPSPCVVVANHPTLIDIVLLIASHAAGGLRGEECRVEEPRPPVGAAGGRLCPQ